VGRSSPCDHSSNKYGATEETRRWDVVTNDWQHAMKSDSDMQQASVWEEVYRGIVSLLRKFGIEDHLGHGDYLVVDDNYGWRRNTNRNSSPKYA
jgi:hypothetical protein